MGTLLFCWVVGKGYWAFTDHVTFRPKAMLRSHISMLWSVVIFKAELSTFFVHLTFFSFSLFSSTFHLSPPPSFFSSGILQQVYLSRPFLLPLPHCLLVLWCFNRWINDCFYFHSVPGQYKLLCSPARVRDRIWETDRQRKKRERETYLVEGFAAYDTVTELSVSSWIYLHI